MYLGFELSEPRPAHFSDLKRRLLDEYPADWVEGVDETHARWIERLL
jgi:hypothetical protein